VERRKEIIVEEKEKRLTVDVKPVVFLHEKGHIIGCL
jgi:hypothetical protein